MAEPTDRSEQQPIADLLTLNIGVTGHRYLTGLDRIRKGISNAFAEIERAFPDRPWNLISPLAEGADRLVAMEALKRSGATLTVPLPMSESEYEKDFCSLASQSEFRTLLDRAHSIVRLPLAPDRQGAYWAAGCYVVDHCDVLIAVWDGNETSGGAGTAAVVGYARVKSKPIVIVSAANAKPGTPESTKFDCDQGKLIVERLPNC